MAELTDLERVRILANDYWPTDVERQVFADVEVQAFLDLEDGSIKLAAAQAIDTIADNEALVGKVIRTAGGLSTDGAKVADALRRRATTLREQDAADGSAFEVVDFDTQCAQPWWP